MKDYSPSFVVKGSTFTALASAGDNSLVYTDTTGNILGLQCAQGTIAIGGAVDWTTLAIGANGYILKSNGTTASWQAVVGTGSVTSVGLSAPTQFTVTGTPVTAAGTLDFAWNTQTANYILAGPTSGGATVPTFRALVAADIPSIDTSKLTSGTLPIARGGTNNTSFTSGRLCLFDGTKIADSAFSVIGGTEIQQSGGSVSWFAGVGIQISSGAAGESTYISVGGGAGAGIEVSYPSSVVRIGFFGATPVIKQTNVVNPSGGVVQDAESRTAIIAILDRLEAYGLFTA